MGSHKTVTVDLCYSGIYGEATCARAIRSLPWGVSRFAHDYAVGTHHSIALDPDNREWAQVDVGWNLDTTFVPLFCWTICVCLVLAAWYFWRLS